MSVENMDIEQGGVLSARGTTVSASPRLDQASQEGMMGRPNCGPYEVLTLALSEVGYFLSTSPYHHVFGIDQDLSRSYGLDCLCDYSVSDCSQIDVSLLEGALSPLLENLKQAVRPEQLSQQTLPLISMNHQQQQQIHRIVTYQVENLFPVESCDIPPDNSRDNIAGDYVFHKATPVPAEYKRELLDNNEWCQRNMSHHFIAITLSTTSGKVIVKSYVDDFKDLMKTPVDMVTADGKAKRYDTLKECFRMNYQVKQAFICQLLPMVDTIVQSVEEHAQPNSDNRFIDSKEQIKQEHLFGQASPVPPSQYSTLQAESNKKRAYMHWLYDVPITCRDPKLDPVLYPNHFKRARQHVGEPSTAAETSVESADEGNSTAQNLLAKSAGKPSTGGHGDTGFSSAQISSSFNQAKRLMQVEQQLSMEIEAERLKTEEISDEDEDTDEE